MISAQVCSGLATIKGHWKWRSNRERARMSTRAIPRESNVTISCLQCCFLRMWSCIQHHTSTSSSFTLCTDCQRASQGSFLLTRVLTWPQVTSTQPFLGKCSCFDGTWRFGGVNPGLHCFWGDGGKQRRETISGIWRERWLMWWTISHKLFNSQLNFCQLINELSHRLIVLRCRVVKKKKSPFKHWMNVWSLCRSALRASSSSSTQRWSYCLGSAWGLMEQQPVQQSSGWGC